MLRLRVLVAACAASAGMDTIYCNHFDCEMESDEHNGQLPLDLGEIWPYIGNNGRLFVSPLGQTPPPQDADQVRAGQCDYLYLVAGRKLAEIQNPSTVPGVCTKPGLLKQGVHVLFCDGHVEYRRVIDPALQAMIDGAK